MKKITIIAIIVGFSFLFNTLPVLSYELSSQNQEEMTIQTLETRLHPQSDKMTNIPFQPIEKPEYLSMQQTTMGNAPNQNVIIVHIKKIRVLDESLQDAEYYANIIIDGNFPQEEPQLISGRETWFEWPLGYIVFNEYKESPITVDIELMIKNPLWFDQQADISPGPEKTLSLVFDPKTGDWSGDDYRGDPSGYGHATGYEDGDFNEKDFEIWFEVYQMEAYNGYYLDGDKLTYWEETQEYNSDPYTFDGNTDFDEDGIPAEWEDLYGYDPFTWDNHQELDPDQDGIQNIEEYEINMWVSHPFVQDIFIEVDFMEGKYFWNQPYEFTEDSAYILTNAFAKRDITMHIDLGIYGGGGDYAPYQERTVGMDLQGARLKYFLQGNPNYWRAGIFHYAFVCSRIEYYDREVGGRMFYTDSFVLARQTIIDNSIKYIYMKFSNPTIGMASVFMHELGHTLGLFRRDFDGIDNTDTTKPWRPDFWNYRVYESCMNYHYTYKLLDYSNGDDDSSYDQDDWGMLDLTRFENI